jgi:phytoene desaturase
VTVPPRRGPARRVVVVGAGLAGLSAACELVGRGHEVTILERGSVPGGRAGLLELEGFRFDTGPTVLTMPDLLANTFAAAGADMDDLLTLRRLDPLYRATFADGSTIRVRSGRDAMAQELRDTCGPGAAEAFDRYVRWVTELFEVEMPNFIARDYDHPLDLARPLGPALRLARLGGFRKLSSTVASHFADERLQRLFSFQAMYAGLAPQRALALYAVISYMDTVGGVFYPEGGMHAVPSALALAAEKGGATLRYGAAVDRILLAGGTSGQVRGIRLDGGEVVPADAVVATPDLPAVYRTLLPGLDPPRRVRRGSYSPSALVRHAGVRGRPGPEVDHHNIHFGGAWASSFRALLDDGTRMPDPSILVTVPTLDDPGQAPPGCSVLYALEPVPNLDGDLDWTAERPAAAARLAAHVAALGYPDDVVVEHVVDPLDWERDGLERGTPFALSHRFMQTGPFRPSTIERRAPGVVFAGSGTRPGVGVPLVLLSGRLAADRVDALT